MHPKVQEALRSPLQNASGVARLFLLLAYEGLNPHEMIEDVPDYALDLLREWSAGPPNGKLVTVHMITNGPDFDSEAYERYRTEEDRKSTEGLHHWREYFRERK